MDLRSWGWFAHLNGFEGLGSKIEIPRLDSCVRERGEQSIEQGEAVLKVVSYESTFPRVLGEVAIDDFVEWGRLNFPSASAL